MTVASDHQSDKSSDRYALYSSPVGPRILDEANTIYESLPTSRYVLYLILFLIEVAAVFWFGLELMR
jgi:hypothetical protein